MTADERLEFLADPTLSVGCFRYRAAGIDEAALDRLNVEDARRRAEIEYVPSTTRVAGTLAIRPCYQSPGPPSPRWRAWRVRYG